MDDGDLAMAHRLQQQFFDEKKKAEEEDLEFARKVQNEQRKEDFFKQTLESTPSSTGFEEPFRSEFGNFGNDNMSFECGSLSEEFEKPIYSSYGSDENAEILRRSLELDCVELPVESPFIKKEDSLNDEDTANLLKHPKTNEDESLALVQLLEMEEKEQAVAKLGLIEEYKRRDEIEDEDRKMAQMMQEMEESRLASNDDVPSHMLTSDDTNEEEYMRKMMIQVQEQQDEELARNFQLQENVVDAAGNERRSGDGLATNLDDSSKPPASTPSPKPPAPPAENSKPMPKSRTATKSNIDEEPISSARSLPQNNTEDEDNDKKLPAKPSSKISDTNINPKTVQNQKPTFENKTAITPTKKKKRTLLSRFLPSKSKQVEMSATANRKSPSYNFTPSSTVPPIIAKVTPVPSKAQSRSRRKRNCVPIREPATCNVCGKNANQFLVALEKTFHLDCFTCLGCCEVIKPTEGFAFTTNENGEKHPLHQKCHAELFGIKCTVCKETIPYSENGMVTYVKHPFFTSEQMCPKHVKNPCRRCNGCNRFEPEGLGAGFVDLQDGNRRLCHSCCRTVIVDSEEAKPLWNKVMNFFENILCISVWKGLRDIPILVVGYETLNESSRFTSHSGSSQIMTRGLCLSEHQSGRKIELANLRLDRQNGSFMCDEDNLINGFTYFQVPDASKRNKYASVTAILCLSGLPSDLSASVLAHEATHAWFKLHPNFDIKKPIPLMVEEGCCQLVANLFLSEGLEPASTETYNDDGPSDNLLRQYFKFTIETDENEIYGTGFRLAAKAYAEIGIEALLSHVAMYREFPQI